MNSFPHAVSDAMNGDKGPMIALTLVRMAVAVLLLP
jgi:hypothetical protein